MKRNTDPSWWPAHLQLVFRVIGEAMAGERLHPDVLSRIANGFGAILPEHQVTFEHRRQSADAKGNIYEIAVEGPRFSGTWPFRSGELESLARACAGANREAWGAVRVASAIEARREVS